MLFKDVRAQRKCFISRVTSKKRKRDRLIRMAVAFTDLSINTSSREEEEEREREKKINKNRKKEKKKKDLKWLDSCQISHLVTISARSLVVYEESPIYTTNVRGEKKRRVGGEGGVATSS